MGRIRTVKPELFTHVGLFDLEKSTSLPIRLSFIGLFGQCDRMGRFKWQPLTLKVGVLPFDNVDFSEILDAMEKAGFVVKYVVDGKEYGYIPTFLVHQSINNREQASTLPVPPVTRNVTRQPRVSHATRGEGKGREGKGRERNTNVKDSAAADPGFLKFTKFLQDHAPRVLVMDYQFTPDQVKKLQKEYSAEVVKEVLIAMHNTKQLTKKYVSAYLTAVNWCKRRKESPSAGAASIFTDLTTNDANKRIIEAQARAADTAEE